MTNPFFITSHLFTLPGLRRGAAMMHRVLVLTSLLMLALYITGTEAYAQSNEVDDEISEPEPEEPPDHTDNDNETFDPAIIIKPNLGENPAAAILNDARRFCRSLSDETYQIDCLAERMRAAADALPAGPKMAPARQALQQAATDLERTVAQYRDTAKPPIRARRGGANPIATARPLAPVREPDLAAAKAQALSILEETQTVLLRAADRSAERALSYQQIAAAVGSNKVLLRS